MLFHSLLSDFPTEHNDFPIAMLDDQSRPPIRSLFKELVDASKLAAKGLLHNHIFDDHLTMRTGTRKHYLKIRINYKAMGYPTNPNAIRKFCQTR